MYIRILKALRLDKMLLRSPSGQYLTILKLGQESQGLDIWIGKICLCVKYLYIMYSGLPNSRTVCNKRTGLKNSQKLINAQDLIRAQGQSEHTKLKINTGSDENEFVNETEGCLACLCS